jgi:hypothetical protein
MPLALPVFAELFDVAAWPIEMRHPNLPMIHGLSAETISQKISETVLAEPVALTHVHHFISVTLPSREVSHR